jgi:hypothetical protein
VYRLTGQQPEQTAAVLALAKGGLSTAVSGLPQLVQSFQQAQQNPQRPQPGLQDLVSGIQNLVGGQDTTVTTQPNKDFFSARAAAQGASQTTSEQQRIVTGQVKMLNPGESSSGQMFPAGVSLFQECFIISLLLLLLPSSTISISRKLRFI